MNFRNLFVLLVSLLLLSCDSDDYPYAEVPSVVLNEFWAQYPRAQDAEFSHKVGGYEVDFELNGKDHSAVIDPSGRILKEKKEIAWKELPAKVQQALQKEYGEKKIEDPEWVKLGEEILYQVEVKRFFRDERIVLNTAGKPDPDLNYWK